MKSFKELEIWKAGMELLEEIYNLTNDFPKEETHVHKQQMRKAAVSIVGNIAEGFGRFTFADKANKFTIARGECTELDTYVESAKRVKLLSDEKAQHAVDLLDRVGRLLSGLINSFSDQKHRPVTSNQ